MLKLTHIGETLIAELFNASPEVRAVVGARLGRNVGDREAVSEARLAPCGDLHFDGASRIDVALVDRAARSCIACEVKLGTKGMAKRVFAARFLGACSTSHGGTRVRGKMPAILERKLPVPTVGLAASLDNDEHRVEDAWLLIVREEIAVKWNAQGRPDLSDRCTVLPLEELVAVSGGPQRFNALARRLLDFDYYERWFR